MALCLRVRLPVRHKPGLRRNDWTDRTGFWRRSFRLPVLPGVIKTIRVPLKIRAIPFETLFKSLDLENFVIARRLLQSVVNLVRYRGGRLVR